MSGAASSSRRGRAVVRTLPLAFDRSCVWVTHHTGGLTQRILSRLLPKGREVNMLSSIAELLAQDVKPQLVFLEANLGNSGGKLSITAEMLEPVFAEIPDVVVCLVSQGSGAAIIYRDGLTFEALKAGLKADKQSRLYDGIDSGFGGINIPSLKMVLKDSLASGPSAAHPAKSGTQTPLAVASSRGFSDLSAAVSAPVATPAPEEGCCCCPWWSSYTPQAQVHPEQAAVPDK